MGVHRDTAGTKELAGVLRIEILVSGGVVKPLVGQSSHPGSKPWRRLAHILPAFRNLQDHLQVLTEVVPVFSVVLTVKIRVHGVETSLTLNRHLRACRLLSFHRVN